MPAVQHLQVTLRLKWLKKDEYTAKVITQVLDTCYKLDRIDLGLPPGIMPLKDHVYILADFTHKGRGCGHVVHNVSPEIVVTHSVGKRFVTVFVRVNGKVGGFDWREFPRRVGNGK